MIIGTSHFPTLHCAIRYYMPYEGSYKETKPVVERKLDEGQIHLGKPAIKPGQKLILIDEGTRYAIIENEPRPSTALSTPS